MLKVIYIFALITLFMFGCSSKHLVSMDGSIIAPKLVEKPLFIYPHIAQVNNLTGKVHLIVRIDEKGKVDSVMIKKSSGYGVLDKSAAAFVKQFKYKPAESNGQPIQFYIKQSVDYSLVNKNNLEENYIILIKELKKKIEKTSPEKQLELQKELLSVYKDFINSNMDYIIFNKNIKEFVDQNSYSRWNDTTNDWPLHFIVFDDFQKSYPNSSVNKDARNLMFEYLKKDFDTIKAISVMDNDVVYDKTKFNQKISSFIKEDYNGLLPDSLNYLIQ